MAAPTRPTSSPSASRSTRTPPSSLIDNGPRLSLLLHRRTPGPDARRPGRRQAAPWLRRPLPRHRPAPNPKPARRSEPFTVRFAMRKEGQTVLSDIVRGEVVFENKLQDDFVMLKSDGYPTYHLGVVVDDTEMEITHAIRGDEWISSAPKHIQLYEALGWDPPVWAHLPLILGPDHKKLSKRSGDTALLDYRTNGYLPEAMINFLAFLGWSLDDHTSILGIDELQEHFDLARVVANPAVFDIERLNFLNGHYIREMAPERWLETIATWCDRDLPDSVKRPIDAARRRTGCPAAQGTGGAPHGNRPDGRRSSSATKRPSMNSRPSPSACRTPQRPSPCSMPALTHLDAIGPVDWDVAHIEAAIRGLEEPLGMKLRKFVSVLYVAEMGRAQGIPLFDSMVLLGRDRALQRLRTARLRLG
ncbi:MAG: glutamate--tRNA ligase family protein [Chitinophagaceae bacterium]